MKVVNVHEANTQLSRLLERAHAGEEVVIAKSGKPYARLRSRPAVRFSPTLIHSIASWRRNRCSRERR